MGNDDSRPVTKPVYRYTGGTSVSVPAMSEAVFPNRAGLNVFKEPGGYPSDRPGHKQHAYLGGCPQGASLRNANDIANA